MAEPTLTPTRKVTVGLLAGAVTVIAVFVIKASAGIELPAEVVAAVQTVLTFGVQWAVPNPEA